MWLITDNISHFHLTNPPRMWIQLLGYWAGCNLPFPPIIPPPPPIFSQLIGKKIRPHKTNLQERDSDSEKLQYWLAEHAKKVF